MPEPRSHKIIYRPDQEDKHTTVIGGVTFLANQETEVPESITINQLVRQEITTPDGIRSRGVENIVKLVDVLKKNPFFEVDGIRAKRTEPSAKLPDDPDAYKGYAIMWIAGSTSAKVMDVRWESEALLREKCGVSQRDLAHILPFFHARKKECAEISDRVA